MQHKTLWKKLLRALVYVVIAFVIPLYSVISVGPSAMEWAGSSADVPLPFAPALISETAATNGIAIGDYDQDGHEDVFLASVHDASSTPSVLMRNDRGTLVDVTNAVGLPALYATSAFFADTDLANGPELFVQTLVWRGSPSEPSLQTRTFRYKSGSRRFKETTKDSGLDTPMRGIEATAAFADLDSDKDLDFIRASTGEVRQYSFFPRAHHAFWQGFFYGGRINRRVCKENSAEFLTQEPSVARALARDFGSTQAAFDRGGCLVYGPVIHSSPGISFSLIAPWRTSVLSLKVYFPGSITIFENKQGRFVSRGDIPLAFNTLPDETLAVRGQQGFSELTGSFFQMVAVDLNSDNLPDIVATNDGGRNLALINRGGFTFTDEGIVRGLDIKGSGMGIAFADIARQDTLDLLITNFGHTFHFFTRKNKFEIDQNMSLSHLGFGWGIAAIDYDLDGWNDLYVSNGVRGFSTEEGSLRERDGTYESRWGRTYLRDHLYHNTNGILTKVRSHDHFLDFSTRPVSVVDINEDGSDDLVLGVVGNRQKGAYALLNKGSQNHFSRVKLIGTRSNRPAIGATISVVNPDGGTEKKLVAIGESFSAQHSLTKTFGLGSYEGKTVQARIHWPSGQDQTVTLLTGKLNVITEPL